MGDAWESIVGWVRDNFGDFVLVKVYIACAVAGGAVLIGQTGLILFGLGDGADVDADMDVDDMDAGGDGLSFLSIRTLASFLTFFGLVGWGGTNSGWPTWVTILVAFAAGASVMIFVAWVLRFFHKMASTGNLDPKTGDQVLDLLLEMNRVHHTALVVVTHSPELAERMGRTAVLVDGYLEDPAALP